MSRWAKPGHRAALGQLSPGIQRQLLAVLRNGHDDEGDAFDRVSYNHDPEELRRELVSCGLTGVDVVGVLSVVAVWEVQRSWTSVS